MEKIDGGHDPKKITQEQYRANLEENITRFQNAFQSLSYTSDTEEKKHLAQIMEQQMALIQANVREIKRSGIQKQGLAVASDYEKYKKEDSLEIKTTLEQDIATLKEYSRLPE